MSLEEQVAKNQTSYVKITVCRLCQSNKLQEVLNLGDQYIVNFVRPEDVQKWKQGLVEPKVPLKLVMCDSCKYVQLQHSVNPDRLYRKFWYKSGINESMRAALHEIVADCRWAVRIPEGGAALDIGCNDGTELSMFGESTIKVGFDPAINLQEEAKQRAKTEHIFADYFGSSYIDKLKAISPEGFDFITAIAMFYDIEDPRDFLKTIKEVLHKDGVFVIQMNYLPTMLEQNAVDNISHEHIGYYSLSVLASLLDQHGLKVRDAYTNDVNGGSIRVFICHSDYIRTPEELSRVHALFSKEEDQELHDYATYKAFAMRTKFYFGLIKTYLERHYKDERIYLYGASTRGTSLMQALDLNPYWFAAAAERNPEKYGLHMVGSWIPICDEETARKDATMFFVLPWHFKASILTREKEALKSGIKFMFPLPTPIIISNDGVQRL